MVTEALFHNGADKAAVNEQAGGRISVVEV